MIALIGTQAVARAQRNCRGQPPECSKGDTASCRTAPASPHQLTTNSSIESSSVPFCSSSSKASATAPASAAELIAEGPDIASSLPPASRAIEPGKRSFNASSDLFTPEVHCVDHTASAQRREPSASRSAPTTGRRQQSSSGSPAPCVHRYQPKAGTRSRAA